MTRDTADRIARRALIAGTVQGVGFRVAVYDEARGLGVTGWVRNLDDGRVEVHAEGPAPLVEALLSYCHVGPAAARVTGVVVDDAEDGRTVSFTVR